MKLLSFFLFTFSFSLAAGIIPVPRSVEWRSGEFRITSGTRIVLGEDSPSAQFIAEQINDELSAMKGQRLKVVSEGSLRSLTANYIYIGKPSAELGKRFRKERGLSLTPEMKSEGYALSVDANGTVILAESERGMFYGVMTLVQMLQKEKRTVFFPAVSISDFPSMKVRGITDDISRGQISTVENFKSIIRFCARYKLNTFSPYIEDVFLFSKHPELGKERGALSAAEWRELDAYAKKYFVEMIPIFETLGHWENILIRPGYEKYAEFPGAHTVNVSDEKTYVLLDEMIGEIAGAFSSPFFNIAADESWDVGLGANRERVKKTDIATVHADHYNRVFAILKKYGKKPMMYGDIVLGHPDIMKKIPKEVVMVDWQYGTPFDYTSPDKFRSAGFPFIVSPAVWNFNGPFPNEINTFLNVYYLARDGYRNGALGMLTSGWNDHGGEALRELNYLGYAWTAECAWNPVTADQTALTKNFFRDFFGTEETEGLRSVYTILADPTNQYHWFELWRHPLLPTREDMIWEKRLALPLRMQSIRSSMPLVQELVEKAKGSVTKNREHLDLLTFIAHLNLWFANKVEAQEQLKLLAKDSTMSRADKAAAIRAISSSVTASLAPVRREFESLWLRTNKYPSLELLLARYDRQSAYWNEMASTADSGLIDPVITSSWITHPRSQYPVKDSAGVPAAYFRTTLQGNKKLASAKVQLLGDSWAILTVNGKKAAEVSARRSLSLTVENQRAKIVDITPLLTDSANVIAVEVHNYQENGTAAFNLYGEFSAMDGSRTFLRSDSTWHCSVTAPERWNSSASVPESWPSAVVKKFQYPVVAPNLTTGRTSWFER